MDLLTIARVPAVAVESSAMVRHAVVVMAENDAGATVIVDDDNVPLGIFTAGDLLRRVVMASRAVEITPVSEVMSSPLVFATRGTKGVRALSVMQSRHIRHLPIVDENGRLRGMLSRRHLLGSMVEDLSRELESLEAFVCADGIGG